MFTEIGKLSQGQTIVITNEGGTVEVGYVRVRGDKAIIFCVGWISPIMNVTDMLLTV